MLSEPKFITRAAEPYAAIKLTVQQSEIPQQAPPLVPQLLQWTGAHAKQSGPVFFSTGAPGGVSTRPSTYTT